MESGSIGQVCYLHQVPFVVIRSISDDASNSEVFDYIKFKQSASQMSIKVIKNFFGPKGIVNSNLLLCKNIQYCNIVHVECGLPLLKTTYLYILIWKMLHIKLNYAIIFK